jgi:TM2 domain-containing membrane protein YozV
MGKILRIEDGKVSIGMDSGEIITIPIAAVSYMGPQIGDRVRVFHSGTGNEFIAARVEENADSAGTAGSYGSANTNTYSDPSEAASSASPYEYGNGSYYGNAAGRAQENRGYYENNYSYNPDYNSADIKTYNKHLFVWLFTFLLGAWGIDRFLRGQVGLGILKLLTGGGCGIWWFVDFIIGLIKAYGGAYGNTQDLVFINGDYER